MTQHTTQHTPGPWYVEGEISPNGNAVSYALGDETTDDQGNIDRDEVAANCNLIAAAPELLEALETVLGVAHVDIDDLGATLAALSAIRHHARAAIAKAKGE